MTIDRVAKLTVVVDARTVAEVLETVDLYLADDPDPALAASGLRFKRTALAAGLGTVIGPVATPNIDAITDVRSPLEPRVIKPAVNENAEP